MLDSRSAKYVLLFILTSHPRNAAWRNTMADHCLALCHYSRQYDQIWSPQLVDTVHVHPNS
jgi:hypothetical protein